MEDSRRKQVLIGIIVACLVLAGVVTYMTSRGGNSGLEAFKGQSQWVKCANQNCGAAYELDKKKYIELVQEETRRNVDATGPVAIVCETCGEQSAFRAEKCEKCGEVFFYGAAGPSDFSDRCPKCGYSAMEEERKQAQQNRDY
jgi:ribosomal protein L40E